MRPSFARFCAHTGFSCRLRRLWYPPERAARSGVSTGIGDHEEKYTGKKGEAEGDEQFDIDDNRSLEEMYRDQEAAGLQPVMNDYVYVQ